MTAYAIDLRPERVTIASDTLMLIPDRHQVRPMGHATKVHPLAHLRAALFGRGMHQIPAGAHAVLALNTRLHSVEDAAAVLPEVLANITAQYCAAVGIADPAAYGLAEIMLCGWSEAEQRMRMWHCLNTEGYTTRDDQRRQYGVLPVPMLPDAAMPSLDGSLDDQLVAVLLAEDRWFRDHPEIMGAGRLGGEIQGWAIDRDGLSMRVLYRWPDYDETLRGSELFDRISRGDEPVDLAAGLFPAGQMRCPAASAEAL